MRVAAVARWAAHWIRGDNVDQLRRGGLKLGEEVFLGSGVYLDRDFCFLIEIEDCVVITQEVIVLAHDASTKGATGYTRVAPVRICRGAFIGLRSIILPGVTVGEDAVIGAGSVVTRDVKPRSVVAGNPAKPVADYDAYIGTHQEGLGSRPVWPREGWVSSTGISRERSEQMLERLREAGEGYIE